MNLRHRNKAITGVSLWFAVLLGFVLLLVFGRHKDGEPDIDGRLLTTLVCAGFIVQYICFFWGGHHLTKAKGYSNAVLFLGLVPCLQILVLTIMLVLPDKNPQPSNRSRTEHIHRSRESDVARIVRYRRNALIGNSLGLFGILIGVVLVLFPIGVFEDIENETVIGIFVFLLGYSGVITGCWWWAKAKGWPEAVVFIGLLPLAIVCAIAAVSMQAVLVLFAAAPALLPSSMVMMPLIMLVIMLVLPDKSGISTKRRR